MREWQLKSRFNFCLHALQFQETANNGDQLACLLNTSSLFNPLELAMFQSLCALISVRL